MLKLALRCAPLLLLFSTIATAGGGLPLDRRVQPEGLSPRLFIRSARGKTEKGAVSRAHPETAALAAESLAITSSGWTEIVPETADEQIQVRDEGDLVLVRASARYDIAAVQIEGVPPADALPTGAANGVLRVNQVLSWQGPRRGLPLTIGVTLLEPRSSVDLQVGSGTTTEGFVNVSAAEPVSLRLDLSSLLSRRASTDPLVVVLRVMRGGASGALVGGVSPVQPKRGGGGTTTLGSGGTASYNNAINWQGTPALTYAITGAPASTCGELDTFRNGSWLYSPGWVCTDSSGNANKGPWTWAGTPSDQTDNPVYVRWPDGTTTNSLKHVWDKTCPTVTRTSPGGTPPSSYYGNASDAQWGACFDSHWSYIYSYYIDTTRQFGGPNLYYNDSTSAYSSSSPYTIYGGSLVGMPSCGVSWTIPFPPLKAHTPGHTYLWQTCVSDGGCVTCTTYSFTAQ